MAVSCAVYNLPNEFPLLDMKIEAVSISGREILDCCEDFSFQDFNPIHQQQSAGSIEHQALDNQHKDPSFSLIDAPSTGFQAAFVDSYGGSMVAPSIDSQQDSRPLFDLWEVPDAKKESIASVTAACSSSSSSSLVEWIGDVPPASMDWQHPSQRHASIAITAEESSGSATAALSDEQYWFSCPQLECQVLQSQQMPQPSNLYAFRRHCPAAMLDNLMVSPPQAIDHGGGGNVLDRAVKVEQQSVSDQFHPGFLPGSSNGSIERPLRSTGRKRMARKRRSLPYQIPFPCPPPKKSVTELIAEKNLEFLLQKQLKPSDVGNLGRIVLPKKEAESCLPYLAVREGMTIVMEDLTTSYKWHMRYRFWPNNKSRMYLLENTGEFIRSHCLKEGDLLRLYKYKDSATGKYVILGKKAISSEDTSSSSDTNNRRAPAKPSPRKRSKSCGSSTSSSGSKSNMAIGAGSSVDNSNPGSVSSRSGSASGSFGSSEREGQGLANFDSFEASDIQEILTSLS